MTRADLIRSLQELGFSEYEAKCYIALLSEQSQTGYSVARASGVPRSKVYEVLEGMVDRGVVIANHGEPTQYAPLSPQELIGLQAEVSQITTEIQMCSKIVEQGVSSVKQTMQMQV